MEELLTPITTTYLKAKKEEDEPFFTEVKSSSFKKVATEPEPTSKLQTTTVTSADEALDALKSQPDYPTLVSVLRFLAQPAQEAGDFQLHVPSPKSAAIVHLLVTEIAPNYWTLLFEGSLESDPSSGHETATDATSDLALFIQCLRSVTGLNAVVAHIKALTHEVSNSSSARRPDLPLVLGTFLDLLSSLLEGDSSVRLLWRSSTAGLGNAALQKTQSQMLSSLLTGGRLLSVVAEAATCISKDQLRATTRWVSDGLDFTKWIGQNLASWARSHPSDPELQFCSDLLRRALSLGYSDTLVRVLVDRLLLSPESDPADFRRVCFHQPQMSKKILQILLDYLSKQFLNRLVLDDQKPNVTVSAVAGVLNAVVDADEVRTSHLVDWCTNASGAGIGDGVGIRRAVLAALSKNQTTITSVLEKSLAQFGDELYIRHAAALQQEAHAQVLLLSAGYVHRATPMKLRILIKSGTYLSAISNRIGATQVRARFLGMVVGETLSELVDGKEKKLSFKLEELETEEAKSLQNLVRLKDEVGSLSPIQSTAPQPPTLIRASSQQGQTRDRKSKPKPKSKPEPKISTMKPRPIIEEVDSGDDDEDDDDLVPYAKGSDPEDSDDDATLVQRNKLKPPVYIRDLVAFFRDSESYDKQKLALQTAPSLIRRKANFGTEVSSHADELAGLLAGVQDKFELEGFEDLRLQGMIALVVAQPEVMAPWFARTFFEGDYSLSQRTAVLITLGLAARELAGFETSQYQSAASFPTKRLPEAMERLYLPSSSPSQTDRLPASQLKGLPPTALNTIASDITSSFLAPLAAKAADATSGPDALKLQSFTSRYKSTVRDRPRVRAIPNTTAALLAGRFFAPLTAHFQAAMRSPRAVVLNPALLAVYLQTLGIIIHSAGPSTLSLPQLTSELWDLLLGVRVHAARDLSPLRGWLVAMAALLEVNGADMRSLCESQGREVVETREWVGAVFERTRGEDGGEENEVKMLAAGILLRLGEAIEKYQALLMGDMIGFS